MPLTLKALLPELALTGAIVAMSNLFLLRDQKNEVVTAFSQFLLATRPDMD